MICMYVYHPFSFFITLFMVYPQGYQRWLLFEIDFDKKALYVITKALTGNKSAIINPAKLFSDFISLIRVINLL